MKDPDHDDTIVAGEVEHDMSPDAIAPVPRSDLVTGMTATGIAGQTLDSRPDLIQVRFGLIGPPPRTCEVPDIGEVSLRRRSESIAIHDFRAAMKAPKSNRSGSPLPSPATSAARKAAIRVS